MCHQEGDDQSLSSNEGWIEVWKQQQITHAQITKKHEGGTKVNPSNLVKQPRSSLQKQETKLHNLKKGRDPKWITQQKTKFNFIKTGKSHYCNKNKQKITKHYKKKTEKRFRNEDIGEVKNLFSHFDDNIGITGAEIANGKIDAFFDADSEKPQQIIHLNLWWETKSMSDFPICFRVYTWESL